MKAMRWIGSVAVAAGLILAPSAAHAQEEDTVEYGSQVSARYQPRVDVLRGQVTSSFTGAEGVEDDCLAGRSVQLSFKRADGSFRSLGTVETDASGIWKHRGITRRGIYRVNVAPSEFVYSPSYGRLERVVCLGTNLRVRLTRDQVLGTRFARGAAAAGRAAGSGQLPFTGSTTAFLGAGLGAIFLGSALLSMRPRRRRLIR